MKNFKTFKKQEDKVIFSNTKNKNYSKVSLKDKLAFLKNPLTYDDEKPGRVEVIETHMSWVFLTDEFVYKLKKPVKSNSLDYSSVSRRKENCTNEVRLNKRLAPDVYISTVPITVEKNGKLELQGKGEIIDWLVKMRRLPSNRMLDYAISNQSVTENDTLNTTKVLADFYNKAEQITITPAEYCSTFEKSVLENRENLLSPQYNLSKNLVNTIISGQLDFLTKHSRCLAKRAQDNKIVEAHGDLRPEHICLLKKPVIIDCLEFNRELRILDPVDELSFLALECERLGAAETGQKILQDYGNITRDIPPDILICFYKSYRACIRAILAIWHLEDDKVADRAKWVNRANEYLHLAEKYINKI